MKPIRDAEIISGGSEAGGSEPPAIPRPMARLSLAFAIGIIAARYFPVSAPGALIFTALLVLLSFFAVKQGYMDVDRSFGWPLAIGLAALFGLLRHASVEHTQFVRAEEIRQAAETSPVLLTGRVKEINPRDSGGVRLIVTQARIEKWKRERRFSGDLEVSASREQAAGIEPGDAVSISGWLTPIRGPLLPGVFDNQTYQYARDVYGELYANQPIERISRPGWRPARGWAYRAQSELKRRLNGETDEDAIGLLSSAALGLRGDLSAAFRNRLHQSGLSHLISISGLHVTLILAAWAFSLNGLGIKRKKTAAFTVVFALFYLCLVGWRVPTLRAVIMAFVLIGGSITRRRVDAINSLGFAAFLILLMDPMELFQLSFQLSFTAVLFLLLFHPLQLSLALRTPRIARPVVEGVLASSIVTAGLASFTLYSFFDVSFGAIAGNLLAIPLLGLLLPSFYLWAVSWLTPLGWLSSALGWVCLVLTKAMLSVIGWCAGDGRFLWSIPRPNAVSLILIFLGLLLLARPLMEWGRLGALRIMNIHAALFIMICAAAIPSAERAFAPLRVDFVSLGQGDCTLIETPAGRTLLMDGGPAPNSRYEDRRTNLETYLLARGIGRIDVMALSHPQSDHIGALPRITGDLKVGMILEGSQEADTESYRRFTEAAARRGVKRTAVQRGDRFTLDGVEFFVLNPPPDATGEDVNEASIVMWVRYRDFDLLLTGDIGGGTESKLADRLEGWDTDVIKVPHHGSRYSSSEVLLDETRPEFAVIEVGRNAYGHPHPDARKRYYAIDAHLLRTDTDGTIQLKTRGEGYRLYASRVNRLFIARP
ncbi:MAG: DNA internalization-related competence protein ComEC/Rec2 [bacterium]|nr:DNA internalization-related competence protein ComEC/Rec2 [bacterium]